MRRSIKIAQLSTRLSGKAEGFKFGWSSPRKPAQATSARRGSPRIKLLALIGILATASGASTRPFTLKSGDDVAGLHILDFQHIHQNERYDCGEGALAIVLTYWGHPANPEVILAEIFEGKPKALGTVASDLKEYSENAGFRGFLLRLSPEEIRSQIQQGRPVIVCRKRLGGINHYEVAVGYNENKKRMIIADPAGSPYQISYAKFEKRHQKLGQFSLLIAPEANGES